MTMFVQSREALEWKIPMLAQKIKECKLIAMLLAPRVTSVFASLLLFAFNIVSYSQTLPEVIKKLADVREMVPEEAVKGYSVEFDGTVLCNDQVPERRYTALFVHDGESGAYIFNAPYESVWKTGQRIRVRARTHPGDFAPCLTDAEIVPLPGTPLLPTARSCTAPELASGRLDSQWVELRGVGRAVTLDDHRYELQVISDGFRFAIRFAGSNVTPADLSRFVDAEIRVRGVCYSLFTPKRQLFGVELYAPDLDCVVTERPAPEYPFATAPHRIDELLTYQLNAEFQHRVKVTGVVSYAEPKQLLFVRDESGGIMVRSNQTGDLKPGDKVEVVGFSAFRGYTAILEDAAYRMTEHGPPARADVINVDEALSGRREAELVTVQGRILETAIGSTGQQLLLENDRKTFRALLSRPPYVDLENGTVANFTGICLADGGLRYLSDEGWRPRSFELLLPSAGNVVVVTKVSWWTAPRILTALVCAIGVLLIAVVWAVTLHYRVRAHTASIRSQVDREAVLEERNRIGREIHDTLAQAFAGTAFQLEAIAPEMSSTSEKCRLHFEHARAMIRYGLAEARRSVTEMRGQRAAIPAGLDDLRECAELLVSDSTAVLDLQIKGTPFQFANSVENNLLRIAQEAVINAVRHANPKQISITLEYALDRLQMEIIDDGCGFTPELVQEGAGHFGLIGMRERSYEAGASLEVFSTPGSGTRVTLRVPRVQSTSPFVLQRNQNNGNSTYSAAARGRSPDGANWNC